MAPLSTFFGRLIRRQGGILDLPDLPIPLPTRSTERPAATTSTSAETTATSSTALPTSTSASVEPTGNSSPPANPPTTESTPTPTTASTEQTSSTPTTSSTPVIVVETTATTNTNGNGNASTTLAPTATGVSVVIENKTVTNSAAQTTSSSLPDRAGASSNSFLDNKVASGIVFGLCGLVGLVLIFLIVWFAMRKSRRIKQLEKEIISFDPEDVGRFHQRRPDGDNASINSLEKGRRSGSSLGQYAGNGYATTMNTETGDYMNTAPFVDYRPQRAPTIQRPGNAAFNSTANSDINYRTYAMPSQTYNQ